MIYKFVLFFNVAFCPLSAQYLAVMVTVAAACAEDDDDFFSRPGLQHTVNNAVGRAAAVPADADVVVWDLQHRSLAHAESSVPATQHSTASQRRCWVTVQLRRADDEQPAYMHERRLVQELGFAEEKQNAVGLDGWWEWHRRWLASLL